MFTIERIIVLSLGLAVAAGAHAQRFAGITSDCAELKSSAARDGVLCHVGEYMGDAALFIQVIPREGDPDVDRARKAIRALQRNFYADGGKQLVTRSVDKAGRTWERHCYRNARFPSGHCNDPVIVENK